MLSLPPAAMLRPITEQEIRTYERDGVVHLRSILDPAWAALLAEGIEELLAEPVATRLDLTAIGKLADQHSQAAASGVAGGVVGLAGAAQTASLRRAAKGAEECHSERSSSPA